MQYLLGQLLDSKQDMMTELVEKFSVKKALKVGAVGGLVGGAALLPSDYTSEPPLKSEVGKASPPHVTQLTPPEVSPPAGDRLIGFFGDELSVIEAAAARNDCAGDDFLILLAIRKAENGGPGNEFGIMHSKAKGTDLDTQAGWAAATVVKNRQRWQGQGAKGSFIEFLGERYCPPEAHPLNKNWVGNVTFWFNKLKRR